MLSSPSDASFLRKKKTPNDAVSTPNNDVTVATSNNDGDVTMTSSNTKRTTDTDVEFAQQMNQRQDLKRWV